MSEPTGAAEAIAHKAPVARELAKVTGEPVPTVPVRHEAVHRKWLAWYLVGLVVTGGLLLAVYGGSFSFLGSSALPIVERIVRGAFFVAVVLALSKFAGMYLLGRIEDKASRYNLERVRRLLTGTTLVALAVTVLFEHWYTAVVSLGLISLILGFALQAPITSFLGWIYIVLHQPYRVGDRVQIGEAKGDVIDIGYLDTTLWECGGPFLSSDHPSGRVIKFPNQTVLHSTVYNYSWPLFPYIWNEIAVQIGYQADLDFVAKTMRDAAEEEIGTEMLERVETYKGLLARTPVDEVQVREHPVVLFRVNPNTWVEAIVRYLVLPRRAGTVRSKLLVKILTRLNAEPDRVQFPKGAMR